MDKGRRSRAVVVDTGSSPYAKLMPLPLDAARLRGFLGAWQKTNRESSIPHGHEKLDETGVMSNFRIAARKDRGEFSGAMFFSDTDLYKWIEAACFELARRPDELLRRRVEDAVRLIGEAQMDDGYIDTYYQLSHIEDRWTDLEKLEMYCLGHLIQAAVAHFRVTGSEAFLASARLAADHVDSLFGPGKRQGCPGHPEIEMALVELYRVTGERRYAGLARFLVGSRGKGHVRGKVMYADHRDAIGATGPEGHAVIQLYLLCGITDLYLETGEQRLFDTAVRTWEDMVTRRMAITGGVGVRPKGEAFGAPYELPNEGTYNETCAQIASFMWCWRLLLATGEARYADLMEWTLYNGILPGIALDGRSFFYGNGLLSRSGGARSPWDRCACCPPNVMRTLSSLGGYIGTTSAAGLQIHLYEQGEISASLGGSRDVRLEITTRYPWDESVTVTVTEPGAGLWALALRIPGWCAGASVGVCGGKWTGPVTAGQPVVISRAWRSGDAVELRFPMPPVYYEAHPHVDSTRCARAIGRGPMIYCIEGHDQPPGVSVLDCALDLTTGRPGPTVEWRPDLLGGVPVIRAPGVVADRRGWEGVLYRRAGVRSGAGPFPATGAPRSVSGAHGQGSRRTVPGRAIELTAIPYYAWANRGPSPMRVWIPAETGT